MYFTILSILRNILYYGHCEILRIPMQWCVVCGVVVVLCAGFGCGGLGLWADDSVLFPQKKNKNARVKIHEERVECPRKP